MSSQRTYFQSESPAWTRRSFLTRSGLGFGGLALGTMLARDGFGLESSWRPPTGLPHFPARAKSVIWIFLRGGLSHMESFDPKPALTQYSGKTFDETPFKGVNDPEKRKRVRVVVVNDANGQQRNKIYPLQIGSAPGGRSGIEVSDWFPHLRNCVDDLAIVRSMWTTDDNHGAQVQFHSGRHMLDVQEPTIGAWVNYGLGSLNDNLPQFINMGPRFFDKRDGRYLGPAYDAVPLVIDPREPLAYARPEGDITSAEQQIQFDLVGKLNRLKATQYPGDQALDARIKSYELAYKMQSQMPAVLDLAKESAATKQLYGVGDRDTDDFGRKCLMARRFIEAGVRFVEVGSGNWDHHFNLSGALTRTSTSVDKPIAGLLTDLKERGLLKDTLVIWGGEFGRTPYAQGDDGRDHNNKGYTLWLAGGGVKGGTSYGSTDDHGFEAVQDKVNLPDLHATILHLLGLDHEKLTFRYAGRDFRLTDVKGEVVKRVLA
ncbi:MAG: DUF1501 domain-containing protein [Verrucomicrobia bacterium]|nr:DUF1501 domain-containing protein [Verrucomicrobiota bacterium]